MLSHDSVSKLAYSMPNILEDMVNVWLNVGTKPSVRRVQRQQIVSFQISKKYQLCYHKLLKTVSVSEH